MTATLSSLREQISLATHADEEEIVAELIAAARIDLETRGAIVHDSRSLVAQCREQASESGTLDAFLQEFGLENPEGVALMCLAEALLRIPDDETADRLIAEKIHSGDWTAHLGKSESLFVNGSVWGLMLTGRLVGLAPEIAHDTHSWLQRLTNRIGEPIVRTAITQAMRILGRQFVLGRTIDEAIAHPEDQHDQLYSFDMLGEEARSWQDADHYFDAYRTAIAAIATRARTTEPTLNDGISVKLSALHPRFEMSQRDSVLTTLTPRLIELAQLARDRQLGFSIDAEESSRLELTLDLFERLAREPSLANWGGLGFVLQTYQKRATRVAEWLVALADSTDRQLMVRVVKGAYWDAEIKFAQQQGFADYPVFTRKINTDLSYEICANHLFNASDRIYPQFATHNATTICQVCALAAGRPFELQRLHGMGELLFKTLSAEQLPASTNLRVYAPVGSHQNLLPYLVRRLLENGANTSFVNRFLDHQVPVHQLIKDPLAEARALSGLRHPLIPAPPDLYRFQGEPRSNSSGLDLDTPSIWRTLERHYQDGASVAFSAEPIVSGLKIAGPSRPILSPNDHNRQIGQVVEATIEDVHAALEAARIAQPDWNDTEADERARLLEKTATLLEENRAEFMYLLGAEAGRCVPDALAEVREAVDFCRYYALQCRSSFGSARELPGPTGELNRLGMHGRGTFACISPWNFPLAIFIGQVSAALAAGNCVLAKPAEQTPLVAARTIRLLHEAGVPVEVLHLLPGSGEKLGSVISTDERIDGIAVTGSVATAQAINRNLAARAGPIVPLIAETGGLNAMLTDSSILPEQLIDDVIDSAFRSAGQRCSALRVLYLQADIADRVLEVLAGAMATLIIGNPLELTTDVGPVIDPAAQARLQRHVEWLERRARLIYRCVLPERCEGGCFFPPQAFEIGSIRELPGEIFGPILHVIRYQAADLDRVLDDISRTGFGLTLGVHSRIDGFARHVFARTRVGNTYVNRNMVGAVVGVQPFGGQGLSGTGPKAGGPQYLNRFGVERTLTENISAKGGNPALFELGDR